MNPLFLILLFLQGGIAHATTTNFPTTAPVHFIILGDTGTGSAAQYSVAKAIEKVCVDKGCQFAIDAGDNIYELGVRSSGDKQFESKFEKPYANLKFPFFMALGNHDQSGTIPGSGVHPENGDFEVEYTKHSTKWMMPKRYYSFAIPFASATDYEIRNKDAIAEIFVVDTNPLAPQNKPHFDSYLPHREYDNKQREWLKKAISDSTAKWKIVLAHHPYVSNGKSGDAGNYFGFGLAKGAALKQMYEEQICGKVDLLVTGHDHSLQWLKPKTSCGPRPEFVISGAGAKANSICSPQPSCKKNPAYWESYQTLGFFFAEATEKQLKLTAYTVSPNNKFQQAFERTISK